MRKKIHILIFAALLLPTGLTAQVMGTVAKYDNGISNDDNLMKLIFTTQVKQMSDFFDRFNGTDSLSKVNPNRIENLVTLVNMDDTVLKNNSYIGEFLKYVSDKKNNAKLSFKDSAWYAIANCSFIYHNKEIPVNIILKPEATAPNRYRWAIYDIQGSFFSLPEVNGKEKPFINPMNHEVGFSELSKALKERKEIFQYTPRSYMPDPLSAFLFYLLNGDIEFKQVNSTEFHFLQLEGWSFTVRDFERLTFNSGWLIVSVDKMNANLKAAYKKNHFTMK